MFSARVNALAAEPKQVQLGAEVLRLLTRDISFYEKLMEARFKVFKGWAQGDPLLAAIFKAVKETLDHWLSSDGSALPLSKGLFENRTKAVEVRPSMTLHYHIPNICSR